MLHHRRGTSLDIRNFDKAFKSLGYEVLTYENKTAEQIKAKVKEMATNYSKGYDSLVLCFSSHVENDDFIFGSDTVSFSMYELISLIKKNTPSLPIFVFVQCSRDADPPTDPNVEHELRGEYNYK